MVVEPAGGDRMYYAASTMICVPTSLDQPVGVAFGARQASPSSKSAITQGGFGKVRKATETPFNMVLEARPLDHRRPAERASRDRQRPGRSTVVVSIPCQRRMTSL